MVDFSSTMKGLWAKQSLARIHMNEETKRHQLVGRVLDVGGGTKTNYHHMTQDKDVALETVDKKLGVAQHSIDFECDPLPYENGTFDMVLMFNILEHIFNHQFLTHEVARVLRKNGTLVGFVPFFVGYHPDPHDYFRYTAEALQKILSANSFCKINIRVVGGGPVIAGYNIISQSLPRIVNVLVYPFFHLLDHCFLRLRPTAKEKFPLGYFFSAQKHA